MHNVSKQHLAVGVLVLLHLVIALPLVAWAVTDDALGSCTIFTVSRDGQTLFCNNEDEGLRHGRVWFIPGTESTHGVVLFGYGIYRNLIIPVGGMNAEGLCVDGTMVDETEVLLDPERPDCQGSYFIDMLRHCSTVAEAKDWLRSYDLLLLNWQQGLVADASGDAMVVGVDLTGALWLTNKSEDYLIAINNINPAQGDDPYHSWRYNTALSMLDAMGTPTVDSCAEILETVQLSSTMFSYIGDLPNRLLYLYSRADYDRIAALNVTDELSRGAHSYDIERLVSEQSGSPSPVDTPSDSAGVALAASIITGSILLATARLRRRDS